MAENALVLSVGSVVAAALIAFVALPSVVAFLGATSSSPLGLFFPLAGFVMIPMSLVMRTVLHARAQRLFRAVPAETKKHGLQQAVHDAVIHGRGPGLLPGLQTLARALIEADFAGTTLRIASPNELSPIEPIDYPFEAQPLNESQAPLLKEIPGANVPTARWHPPVSPGLRRCVAFVGGWVAAVSLLLAGLLVLVLLGLLLTYGLGFPAPPLSPISLVLLAIILVLLMIWARSVGRRQWFVAPRALIVRRAGWLQSRWKLHLFERRHSVLCVLRQSKAVWRVVVGDARSTYARALTRAEAQFLLRTWLSPLPPPSLDRLSDFA